MMPMPSLGGWGRDRTQIYSARRAVALWVAISLLIWLAIGAVLLIGL